MVRLLGLGRLGESAESPREITRTIPTSGSVGEAGWLIRFFDSAFFCEWIAVSYLYKHDHAGVRDYLCNRMYTLPLSGIESYLFQICYMLVHKPSPSLDKFVIDICCRSLKIALKVHWFLMAELEDTDDNEGISRIQEKCQIAATLMGEWPPLIRPQSENAGSPFGKNQMLNKLLSSKQKLLSLTTSPPSGNALLQLDTQVPTTPEENKLFKKLIPSPRVREALLFRKSVDKDDEESEKDGFFKRLLRESRDEDGRKIGDRKDEEHEKDGFFRKLLSSSRDDDSRRSVEKADEESEKDGFFKRLLSMNKDEDSRRPVEKDDDESEKEGFFKRLLRDSKDGEEEISTSSDGFLKRLFRDNSKNESADKQINTEDDGKDGFFRKIFKEKFEEKNDGNDRKDDKGKASGPSEDDGKEGFLKKMIKEIFEDKKEHETTRDDGEVLVNGEEEEPSDFPLFSRLFRLHPGDQKVASTNENNHSGNTLDSSPGTERFFQKLFRDRDRSMEDSELLSSKRNKENGPGSPRQQKENQHAKPPLPNSSASQFRKGTYHSSLDFVESLGETSYGLIDVFPIEDRKNALRESLAEINGHVAAAQSDGGVCFPMGKGMYRVVHIPDEEAVLLNSREKAPYLICVEVLQGESQSKTKDTSNTNKLSKGGIPLANGDALLPKPPPWAYPLGMGQDMHHSGYDGMSGTTSQAFDQAMAQIFEAKVKSVHVNLSVEECLSSDKFCCSPQSPTSNCANCGEAAGHSCERKDDCNGEWVRVVLTADPGVRMDDIVVDQEPPRRKEHRRVPSTVAIEEVKAAALKGEAPPGLPLKGAGQDSPDFQLKVTNGGIPTAADALSGELWEVKRERIRKASVHGNLPGWDLRSVIVKSGDDCRQEHLAVQLISHFYDIFQEAGLPLWLRPYEVLVTSSYTALIETISDTASIHSIKSRYPNVSSLRDFFVAKYQENSPSFKLAQRNFVESMAGYSLVCYLLQVKDRHNGNLLLDEEGHIIHIDFGFMLSNSPGGVNFESAPFKLTRELLEVMDSDAEGVPSEFFDYFKVLCIQGFLTCRKHAERIILLVEMVQDSGFPCFKGGPRTIQNLRKRFHLSLTEEQCVSLVLSLISSSLDAWRTRQYDYYQRVLNGIL